MKVKKANEVNHRLPAGKTLECYPYALSDKLFHTKQLFLYSEKVLPGKRASAAHYHKSLDEIIYVTSGELWAIEAEEEVLLCAGDSACFQANSKRMHHLENRSKEEAEFLIFRKAIQIEDVVYENR